MYTIVNFYNACLEDRENNQEQQQVFFWVGVTSENEDAFLSEMTSVDKWVGVAEIRDLFLDCSESVQALLPSAPVRRSGSKSFNVFMGTADSSLSELVFLLLELTLFTIISRSGKG